MVKPIPPNPNLEYDKKQAKQLLKAVRRQDDTALGRVRSIHPRYGNPSITISPSQFTLADALLVIAREYGYPSWNQYKSKLGVIMSDQNKIVATIQAIISGDADTLKTLLAQHPELITQRGYQNTTLLHYVSANGVEDDYQKTPPNGVEIAEILLEAGADPNVTSDIYGGGAGSTPLVGLVSSAHPYEAGIQADLVHIFVKHGANPDGIHNKGVPMATALEFWYPDAFQALVASGGTLYNIVFASADGNLATIQQMLSAESLTPYHSAFGNIITDRNQLLQLAFVKASLCGQIDTVRYLHQHSVNINGTIAHNRTALHEASWIGHADVVTFLLDNGADATIRDQQFHSMPIQWAYLRGNQAVFEALLPYSPLTIEMASQFGLLNEVQAHLQKNPDLINGTDQSGAPLRAAISYRHENIVRYLLENGADPTQRNANNMNAFELAQRVGHDGITTLLSQEKD